MKLNAFKNYIEKEIVNFMLSILFHVRIVEADKKELLFFNNAMNVSDVTNV